jgi:hypothetical protein
MHWRGEPDPFKGDVPNARVREFSKEVAEVMFNAGPVQASNNTLAAQVSMQAARAAWQLGQTVSCGLWLCDIKPGVA